jgi:hypothetical protein
LRRRDRRDHLALNVLEPWNSGIGGGGAMVLYRAAENRYEVIDYGMCAPQSLRVADYPLSGEGAASDLFPWPRVKDDRNSMAPARSPCPASSPAWRKRIAATPNCRGKIWSRRPSHSPAKACWSIGGPR